MKGISTIIASIILVVITIGLISVAYLYMSGLMTGITATNIKLEDVFCNTTHMMYLITNIGTTNVSDVSIYMDGSLQTKTCNPTFPIVASGSTSCTHSYSGFTYHQLRVVGPSNAIPANPKCPTG
jgi:FlaG/FlaF family flagellin (archaellin)